MGKHATADDVRFLTEKKLRPLGVLRQPDGAEPEVERANPLLALRLKLVLSNPVVTRRLTAPFMALFRPAVVIAALLAFAVAVTWVGVEKGLASAAHQALYEPGLLLLVFALTLLSTGFHEIGHAAACRYGGASPGVMGAGLYLIWPAFYTDVTDSYRLGRAGRLRVDLGGLYFNAVFAVAMFGLWAAVGWDALLLVVGIQVLQMVRQLVPLVRFDGYHILADLTGVPDLFQHIKPTLLGLLPSRWGSPESKALKPWARAVVTLWVLIVVPLLAAILAVIIMLLPRFAATAWDSLGRQWETLETNWVEGDPYAIGVRLLSFLAISIPLLSIVYLLARIVRRTAQRVWRGTAGRPLPRAAAAVAGAALLATVAWAWWPDGQYRPIEPEEGWTLADAVPVAEVPPGEREVAAGPFLAQAPPRLLLPAQVSTRAAAPIRAAAAATPAPRLGLVLLPKQASGADAVRPSAVIVPSDSPAKPGVDTQPRPEWIFPFDPPAAPREGDNQALAVNTTDGSTVYRLALALVWVTDGGPVENRNEAYAVASCTRCQTVAVAFQVVLVIGRAEIVTPLNAAVAVNYECDKCATQALAVQLLATLSDRPSDQVMSELEAVWTKLNQLSETFQLRPLDEVYAELTAVQTEILEILARGEGPVAAETSLVEDGVVSPDATATTPIAQTAEEPQDETAGPPATTTEGTDTPAVETPAPSEDTSTSTTTTIEEPTTTTGDEETPTTTGEDTTTTGDEEPGTTTGEEPTGTTTEPATTTPTTTTP